MSSNNQLEMLQAFKEDLERVRAREADLCYAVEKIRGESEAIQAELLNRKATMEALEKSKSDLTEKTSELESTVHRLQYEIEEEKSRAESAISEAANLSKSREKLFSDKQHVEAELQSAAQENEELRGQLVQASDNHKKEILEMQTTFKQLMDESATQLGIVRQLQIELSSLGDKYESTCSDLKAALAEKEVCSTRIAQLQDELENTRKQLSCSDSEVEALRSQVQQLTQDRDQLSSQLQTVSSLAEQSQDEIQRQNQILADLGAAMQSKDERIEELSNSVTDLEGYLSSKDCEIHELDERLSTVVNEASRLHSDLADKADKLTSLTHNFGELNWTVESVRSELEDRCSQMQRFSMELEELARQNCVLKEMVENLTSEKTSLIMENHSIHYDYKALAEENENTKRELQTLRGINDSHQQLSTEAFELRSKLEQTLLENETWKQCLEQIKTEKDELVDTTDTLNKTQTELAMKNFELQTRLETLTMELGMLKAQTQDLSSANSDLQTLSAQFENMQIERNNLRHEMEIYKAQCQDLSKTTESLSNQCNTLSSELQQLSSDNTHKDAVIGSLQEQYNQVYAQVKALRECVVQLEQERAELSKIAEKLELEKQQLTSKMTSIEDEASSKQSEIQSLMEKAMQIDQHSQQFQVLQQLQATLQEENSCLKQSMEFLRQEKEQLQDQIDQLQRTNLLLEAKSKNLETRITDSCSELEDVQKRADAMTARAEAYALLGESTNSDVISKMEADKARLEASVQELTLAKVSLLKEKDLLVSENAALKQDGSNSAHLMETLLGKLDELGSKVGESSKLKAQLRIVLNCAKEAANSTSSAQVFEKTYTFQNKDNLQSELETAQQLNQDLLNKVSDLEAKSKQLPDQFQTLQAELSSTKSTLAEKESQLHELALIAEKASQAAADTESNKQNLHHEIQDLQKILESLVQEKNELSNELNLTQQKFSSEQTSHAQSKSRANELTNELNNLLGKYNSISEETSSFKSELESRDKNVEKLTRDVSEFRYMLSIAERETLEKEKELQERDLEIANLRSALEQLKADIQTLRSTLLEGSSVSEHLITRLKTLEDENQSLVSRLEEAETRSKLLAQQQFEANESNQKLLQDLNNSMELLQQKDTEIIRLNNLIASYELKSMNTAPQECETIQKETSKHQLLESSPAAPVLKPQQMLLTPERPISPMIPVEGWMEIFLQKEQHLNDLLARLDEKQRLLEQVTPTALTLGQSEELIILRDRLGEVLTQKQSLTTALETTKQDLDNLREKYSDEIATLTSEINSTQEAIEKKESDLGFLRQELDRILLECQRWKFYAKEIPLQSAKDDSESTKDQIIANLRTELEIVNHAKTGLVFQLERKESLEKIYESLTKDSEDQRIMISNLQAELEIVNKSKTILACQRSLDEKIEKGYEALKLEVETLDAELQVVGKAKLMLENQLCQLKNEHEHLKLEWMNQEADLSDSIRTLTSDCAEKIAEISVLTDNLDRVTREKIDLESELQSLKSELSTLDSKFHETVSKTSTLDQEAKERNSRIQDLEAQLSSVSQEKQALLDDLRTVNSEVCQLRAECDVRTSELFILKSSAEGANQEATCVKENLLKLDQQLFPSRSESDIMREEREALKHAMEEKINLAETRVKSAVDQLHVIQTQNEALQASLDAKEIDVKFLKSQLDSQPLTQALASSSSNDELLGALRRELDRRNAYIEELTASVVKLSTCNTELTNSVNSRRCDFAAPETDIAVQSLQTELQHKDLELTLIRHEYEQVIKETEEKYENTLSALQQQVDSAQSYQETAEKYRQQLLTQEQDFNFQLESLKSVNPKHASEIELTQLRRQVADYEERMRSIAQQYESKVETLVHQLSDNLTDQERDLGERFEIEFEDRARMERAETAAKHKQEIDAINNQWEDRLHTLREEMLRQQHANDQFTSTLLKKESESNQMQALQKRVQELQDLLEATSTPSPITTQLQPWTAEDSYQGRIQELIAKLGEMEAEKNRLKRKIDELNRLHAQEIQSYVSTIQSCFSAGSDVASKFEHLRKMQQLELANAQARLRVEYEAKVMDLKTRFEDKLRELKESMLRHGPMERELLSRSRSPAFGSRPISPGVLGFEVSTQINQLIIDFITDMRTVEGVPDRLKDKVAALKRRAELVSTNVTRETQAAVERERLNAQDVQDELEEKFADMEARHKLEIAKLAEDYNSHKKEMEFASQAALAAVHSGTTSLDVLKQQLMEKHKEIHLLRKKHKSEMKQMKKLLELQRAKTPSRDVDEEDVVRMEYLRDILFQYMTGKNSSTLARMISAVVNFNQDQTKQILQHETKRMDSHLRSKGDRMTTITLKKL